MSKISIDKQLLERIEDFLYLITCNVNCPAMLGNCKENCEAQDIISAVAKCLKGEM